MEVRGGGGRGTADAIDLFHTNFPHQPTIGTETSSVTTTRGIYKDDPKRGYVNAYGLTFPGYTLPTNGWWSIYAERSFLSGAFAWTGFDYRGEPDPFHTVSISSQFGAMDTCGFPKDMYFYYKAWWGEEPVLHVFPHWNWAGQDGLPINVWCYSNLDAVELLLNGRSLGVQAMRRNGYLQWEVPYEPGEIEARGYRAGKVVRAEKRETTGPPAKLRLTSSRANLTADREDMTSVRVEVLDDAGRLVPVAPNMVEFTLGGPGRIIGLGNGDPSCREADKPETPSTGKRSVFGGLAMVYLQALDAPGTLLLNATAVGLEPGRLLVQTQSGHRRLAVPADPDLAQSSS
jgi:beta-galactosidase